VTPTHSPVRPPDSSDNDTIIYDANVDTESDNDDRQNEWQMPNLNWHRANNEQPMLHNFTGHSGIQMDTTDFRPYNYFKLYVNNDLIRHLVTQTNLFADQYIAAHPQLAPRSDVREWRETNAAEMEQFLGLVFLMGIIKKPSVDMYWSTDPIYATPLFSCVMTRTRFRLLLRFFHFNDNSTAPNPNDPARDRLYKIRPLIDHLFEMFQSVYIPEARISVDESLLLWKGRLIFRQYIPLKRARFGIKIYSVCETSGYMYRFRVYTGKEDQADDIARVLPREVATFKKPEKVVLYLTLPLLDQGYTVFMDNWYTTSQLFSYLHHRKTNACGTVRRNQVPPVLRVCELRQVGSIAAYRSGPLLCLKFKDKKDVHVMTTVHTEETRQIAVRGRRPAGQPQPQRQKPVAVIDYNANMGGVDRHDQMLQPYSAARKSMKWYRKLGIHFLQIALLNAHILYKKDGGGLNFLKFQHEIIGEMVFNDTIHRPDNASLDVIRLTERHFPDKLEPTATWSKPQARCRVCSKKGIRRDVKTFCPDCPNRPGLCVVPCFKLWHTKLQLDTE
jgi:hypothetical protein